MSGSCECQGLCVTNAIPSPGMRPMGQEAGGFWLLPEHRHKRLLAVGKAVVGQVLAVTERLEGSRGAVARRWNGTDRHPDGGQGVPAPSLKRIPTCPTCAPGAGPAMSSRTRVVGRGGGLRRVWRSVDAG